MSAIAPCAGMWDLFDSTDWFDHRRAKQLCDTCPMIAACRESLAEARSTQYSAYYGPRGTWAGELLGTDERRSQIRVATEEQMFTDAEARAAHAAWARTPKEQRHDLSDRIRIGERVYQRRWKRGWRDAPSLARKGTAA